MSVLVEFLGVSKSFGDNVALKDVSFKINQGGVTTLIGQNGAGKTTLARLAAGIDGEYSGKIFFKKGLKIGYVPQKSTFNPNIPMIVSEFLSIVSGKKKWGGSEFLEFAKFGDLKEKKISSLSGGQFQKLVLAAAFLRKPDLIILDEPTQYLDFASREEFYGSIESVTEKSDISVFMVSHDLYTVMKKSSRVICLNKHICCSGEVGDIEKDSVFAKNLSELGLYKHRHDHMH